MSESSPLQEGTTKGNKKNYKQKTKRHAPPPKAIVAKPLPEAYIKQKEIPMYDPYTGEPNPYYEELTGKKNPLLKNIGDAISNTKNGNNHNIARLGKDVNVPEFGRKNRFLVWLPKEFGVKPYFVKTITTPKIKAENVKVLGFETNLIKYIVEDIILTFNLPVTGCLPETISIHKTIMGICLTSKKFDFKIELLQPDGKTFETWEFKKCSITNIDFGTLDYSSDSMLDCKVVISPSNYIVK